MILKWWNGEAYPKKMKIQQKWKIPEYKLSNGEKKVCGM